MIFICFIYLHLKKIKEQVGPKCSLVNTHWYTIIFFKTQVINSEEAFIYEKRHSNEKNLKTKLIPLKALLKGVYDGWLYIGC